MADPIERVARKIYTWRPGTKKRSAWSDKQCEHCCTQAHAAISEYKTWLTEQGIPIDRLLSGKARVIPSDTNLSEYVECGCCERSIPVEAATCPFCRTVFADHKEP